MVLKWGSRKMTVQLGRGASLVQKSRFGALSARQAGADGPIASRRHGSGRNPRLPISRLNAPEERPRSCQD